MKDIAAKRGLEPSMSVRSLWALPVLLAGLVSAQADGLSHWTWRNPLPSASSLQSVTYGDGVFVAVGTFGARQWSVDGVSWNTLSPLTTDNLNKVVCVNGLFVAVGDHGMIMTSTNGSTWVQQASGTGNALYAVAYGNSTYVAVGAKGTVVTSANGTQWTAGSTGTNDLGWIASGNGVFVLSATQPPSFAGASVLVSTNATAWSPITVTPAGQYQSFIYGGAFGNGGFLLLTLINSAPGPGNSHYYAFTSTDGTTWQQGPPFFQLQISKTSTSRTIFSSNFKGIRIKCSQPPTASPGPQLRLPARTCCATSPTGMANTCWSVMLERSSPPRTARIGRWSRPAWKTF